MQVQHVLTCCTARAARGLQLLQKIAASTGQRSLGAPRWPMACMSSASWWQFDTISGWAAMTSVWFVIGNKPVISVPLWWLSQHSISGVGRMVALVRTCGCHSPCATPPGQGPLQCVSDEHPAQ